ncbi:MAG: dTMP kinase [Verrucomicrobiota bacterium]|nr:dTMP kinase [Limisphaera sp.]MDW8381210.1 dTMP kinase [Verrucomicrobiota bacterium]
MKGLFISFEGTEGSGKTTQVALLAESLRDWGRRVRVVREPGGTPIGEEIRHTLKHSQQNQAMAWETELLLMNASRAQLVREVIRPALAAGEIVLCDRFADSTIAYQGYGRGLDLEIVRQVIQIAVGDTKPDLTLLLDVPPGVSRERLRSRQATLPFLRDRIEEADAAFFERVARGYRAIAAAEPQRVRVIDATGSVEQVRAAIWREVAPLVALKAT